MGVHILCLFLSTPGPLEEQSTPQGLHNKQHRGAAKENKEPFSPGKARPGKGSRSQGSAGIKKALGKQNKSKDNEASMVLPCMSWAPCLRGLPYTFCQKGNMSLVYKNYRLASEFNPYPLNCSPSLGNALCRVSCSPGLERGEQLKIFSLSCYLLLSLGSQRKVRAWQRAAGFWLHHSHPSIQNQTPVPVPFILLGLGALNLLLYLPLHSYLL